MYNINSLDREYILIKHDANQENSVIYANIRCIGDETELIFSSEDLSSFISGSKVQKQRLDELWKENCFELFISKTNNEYREYNFDTNGNWQCYDFKSYRSVPLTPDIVRPIIKWDPNKSLTINIKQRLGPKVNICVILRDRNDVLHYYSIKKVPTKSPDFHNKNYWSNIKVDGQYS
jgi:hypothetical protein